MTHHPHVHVIVPGGGLSPHGSRWIACRPGFFLPVKVLSRLFLDGLARLHKARKLAFFGRLAELADPDAFAAQLAPLCKTGWEVYTKPPFGGPKAVLTYLSRYTHRVAISNHRLISAELDTVGFRWKDYRIERGDLLPSRTLRNAMSREGMKIMRLPTHESIRRFLMHVLPPLGRFAVKFACRAMDGFQRIRHAGLLASAQRKANIARARVVIGTPRSEQADENTSEAEMIPLTIPEPCPCCDGTMRIIETFQRGEVPRSRASPRKYAA